MEGGKCLSYEIMKMSVYLIKSLYLFISVQINENIKIFDMITEFLLCLLLEMLVSGFSINYSTPLA